MDADELALVRGARSGDAEAFRGIVETYSRPLWRAAWRVLGDAAAAEDAVQDAFLRAWRALDRFDERAELSTWLYRIAVNAAIDLRRERGRAAPFAASFPHDFDGQLNGGDRRPTRTGARSRAELVERTRARSRPSRGGAHGDPAPPLRGPLDRGDRARPRRDENAAKQSVFRAVHKLRAVSDPLMEVSRGEPA